MMSEPSDAAETALASRDSESAPGPAWLVRKAPGPDQPDERDHAGAQKGMAIALVGGGVFWAAVIGAAAWFLRR